MSVMGSSSSSFWQGNQDIGNLREKSAKPSQKNGTEQENKKRIPQGRKVSDAEPTLQSQRK